MKKFTSRAFKRFGSLLLATTLVAGSLSGLVSPKVEAANVTTFSYTEASNWKTVVTGLSGSNANSATNTGRLSVSMDGNRVAYNDGKNVYLYDESEQKATLIYTTDTNVNPSDAVISDDGQSVAFYRGNDLVVWKEGTGAKVVFSSTVGTLRAQLTMSSDASVIGFVSLVSGTTMQYAIYDEATGQTKEFTSKDATGGANNFINYNLGSTPTLISPDGKTAYLSHYYSTGSVNANYIDYYDIESGTITAQYSDSAENVHPHGITRDGKYLYGMAYYYSTNNFQIRAVDDYKASKKSLATGTAAGNIAGFLSNGSYINGTTISITDGTATASLSHPFTATNKKGFSGDGTVIYGMNGTDLYRLDLNEIIGHFPDIGLTNAPVLTVGSATRAGVTLNFKATGAMASNTYQVYRDDVLVSTSTQPTYTDASGLSGQSYKYSVKVRGVNGEYSEFSNEVVSGKPAGVETKLGSASVKAGDYVKFGPYKWRLIGNDRLMAADSYITRIYDTTTSLDQLFGLKYDSNIGSYLNDVVLSLFTDEEQDAIKLVNWTVSAKGNTVPLKVTKAKVGLLTSDEYANLDLPYYPPTGWTLTPSTNSTTPNSFYTGATTTAAVGTSTAFYPVINLNAGINILSGTGLTEDPYVIGGGEITALDKPTGLKLTSVTSDEVQLTWTAVVNATSYDVLQDNKVVGTVTTPGYKGSAGEAGKEHVYTVIAKTDKLTSLPSDELKVTTPEVSQPPVTDPGTTDPDPVVVAKPENFRLLGKTETSATLAWTNAEGTTAKLTQNGVNVYEGSDNKFTAAGLTPGSTYMFELVAVKDEIESGVVVLDVETNNEYLAYPIGLTVTEATYNGVKIQWVPVLGAESYDVTRNGQMIDSVTTPDYEDLTPVAGTTNYYGVIAVKGSVMSKESKKAVYVSGPSVDEPGKPTGLKVIRIYHDQISLEWQYEPSAEKYRVFRDDNALVYEGPLTAFVDTSVSPSSSFAYKVVAVNAAGNAESETIIVTTPAEPAPIPVYAAEPQSGSITFEFATVVGAYAYGVSRNPEVSYIDNGNGTFNVTRTNTVTGETENIGTVSPNSQGQLPFVEEGVQPGQDHKYRITAYKQGADGSLEEIGNTEQTISTPADGSGVSVPGTIVDPGTGGGTTPDPGTGGGTTPNPDNGGGTTPDPGTGGGTTPGGDTGTTTPPTTGGGNAGGSTGGGSGGGSTGGSGSAGGSTGGSTTTPAGEDQSPVPGTVTDPSKGEGSEGSTGGNGSEVENETNYSDISGNFAEEAIKNLTASGILKGYADGTFGPNKKITRAEFAIMTKRAMGYQNSGSYVQAFNDFNENAWYAEELLTALDSGVTKGFTDGTYRPNVFIPREQAAVMIANILEKNNFQANLSEKIFIDDKDIIAWAKSSVYLLKSHKIVEGQNNFFNPKREITRAEAAVMIDRLLNVLNK